MKKIFLLLVLLKASIYASSFIEVPSKFSVGKTVATLTKVINAHKAFSVFTIIDHHKNAQGVQMKMPQTQLIIFGNPKAGTLLMKANPFMAYELPLKILVTQKKGTTVISYRDPQWLATNYQLYKHPVIPKMEKMMKLFVSSCL